MSHGHEKEEFLRNKNEMVTSFKDGYKTLLTFFNKDIEMFYTNKSCKLKIKLVHTHVGVVCEYIQMYSYWFRPWLLS